MDRISRDLQDDLVGTVCHYTSGDTAFRHIIPWGQLRMSPYRRMRDPLENRELPFVIDAEDSTDPDDDELADYVIRYVHLQRDRLVLLSLTQDATEGYREADTPFMRAWARARMWEQYARDHTGVCIAFDRTRLLAALGEHLNREGGSSEAGAVTYRPCGFSDTDASRLRLADFKHGQTTDRIADYFYENSQPLFFTKSLDWRDEHEFRVVHSRPLGPPGTRADDDYVHVPFGDRRSVRAVILGEHFPDWQLPAARWACKEVGLRLLQMRWMGGLPWPLPVGEFGTVPGRPPLPGR